MYDRRFFASSLGQSALLSIAAMVTFAIFASAPHETAFGRADAPAGSIRLVALA